MNCCHVQTEQKPHRCWWRGAGGCAGSGALLLLLPKCPLCIAAYVALWTGAGAAMPIAARLRPFLEILFTASFLLFVMRFVSLRTKKLEKTEAIKQEQPPYPHSPHSGRHFHTQNLFKPLAPAAIRRMVENNGGAILLQKRVDRGCRRVLETGLNQQSGN